MFLFYFIFFSNEIPVFKFDLNMLPFIKFFEENQIKKIFDTELYKHEKEQKIIEKTQEKILLLEKKFKEIEEKVKKIENNLENLKEKEQKIIEKIQQQTVFLEKKLKQIEKKIEENELINKKTIINISFLENMIEEMRKSINCFYFYLVLKEKKEQKQENI